MKKSMLIGSLALSMSLSTVSIACDSHGTTGFLPENNLSIPVGDKMAGNMTEARFLEIVGKVSAVYAPIITSMGATLKMNNDWKSTTVNASAQQYGTTWQVNMFGGLARHRLTTDDGFMMVVCHELGHHIGGAPRYDNNTDWASNEGQADYFAGLKCMKRVLQNEDNIAVVAGMTIDAEATKKCEAVYKSASEIALCQRISMAGKSLGSLLGDLGGNSNVNFNTPDKKTVKVTNDAHPAAQCRLDTYFHGTLCDKSIDDNVSKEDAIPGTCIKKDGYAVGVRPLCWYKPGTGEI
ncbi:MAG: hypothetical protein K2Q18_14865 [Bdellovibrionales bacterium]|nr:hypothetical protein [Bdellovibrionales bacterium]